MEGLPLYQFCTIAGCIAAIWSAIYAGATFKAQLNNFPKTPQNQRYSIFGSFLNVALAGALIGVGLAFKPPQQAITDNETPQQRSCPCPEVAKAELPPSTDPKKAPSSTPAPAPKKSDSINGVDFLIKGIKLTSNNALMGDFPIKHKVGDDKIFISIVNPDFRVGSDNEHPGAARWVTQLQVFVGEHSELVKISRDQRGRVDASEPFDLTETKMILNQGEQRTLYKTIEVSIPRRVATNLAGKSVLIKMHNRLSGSKKPFTPAYALSDRNVF